LSFVSSLAPRSAAPSDGSFAVDRIRSQFPILASRVNGKPLVYLDNAATTQKPQAVIDAVSRYYASENANIHRGVHYLSQLATEEYEGVRRRVAEFVNAASPREIIFVRGTTEAINLVAQSYGRALLRPGDEVLITGMEHHSNIVPWQLLAATSGIVLRVAPIDDAGNLDWQGFEHSLNDRTRLVAVVHLSNALGTINPIRRISEAAHTRGIPVLVDGAQSAAHLKVDVQELGCDFYAFSGHKLFGPTGIGVLYGRAELLEGMPPWQGGGDMISSVTFEASTWADFPAKFEAGTPHIAGVVGLGAAINWITSVGLEAVAAYEHELLNYATAEVSKIPGVRIVGAARERASILSFAVNGVHPHDVGQVLDAEGIAIRAGHHCAQPVMARFGVAATARASFAAYNSHDEVDALVRGIHRAKQVFGA
jgi:cysteine desulfurase / selenocysteine lyase